MKIHMLLFTLLIIVFLTVENVFAQLDVGVVCDSDQDVSKCLDNTPHVSIDGISIIELVPFILPGLIFVIIVIILVTVIIYRKKRICQHNPNTTCDLISDRFLIAMVKRR